MAIRVALIDDNLSLISSVRQSLLDFQDIGEVMLCTSGIDFINNISVGITAQPDVVLMDISMGYSTEGIQATKLLHELYPAIKVIMFTIAEDDERVFEAFKAGAVGYLLKNEKPDFIVRAIHDVMQGGALISPGIALKTIRFLTQQPPTELKEVSNRFQLSDRELEVLRQVAKGFPYKLIADQLSISTDTVKKHLTNIFKKLHVRNKIEAINKTKELL